MPGEEIDLAEVRRLLRTLGMRPSTSADAARAREREEIDALTVAERMRMALRLGRRDRAVQRSIP